MYAKKQSLLHPLEGVEVFYHTQYEQKGLGHAIMMARDGIQGPFLVLLGDNILTSNHAHSTNSYHRMYPSNSWNCMKNISNLVLAVYDVGIVA